MTAIIGNTYPIKDQLKRLGAKWDGDQKAWLVPDTRADEARALLAAVPAAVPGKCSKCGKPFKAPYTLCLDCKPRATRCKQCGASPGPRGWPRIYRNGICSDCYKSDREEAEMGY